MLSTQSDERLVDLVRAGSDPAFEAIVERYRRALMRYVSRLLPPDRAEDVVQQSFVKAYEAMHRDAAELNLRPWLYRIAHNGALNALRDRALGHAELDERIDGVERPEQALERATGLRELVVGLQALPERQRSAILLRELEGRSYEEIAAALGVTDGAVRQLLNRARNSLRAAAAAVTPMPLVTRLASAETTEPVTARVAELVGVGGGGLAMKVVATALVTGAAVGGAAVVPNVAREQSKGAPVGAEEAQAADEGGTEDAGAGSGDSAVQGRGGGAEPRGGEDGGGRHASGGGDDRARNGDRRGDDGDDRAGREDHSGHGGGPGDDREERSGRRGGDGDDDDPSGPGGGDDPDDPDGHSGPGGGGPDEPDADAEEAREDHSGPGGGGTPEPPDDDLLEPPELDSSGSGSGSGSSGSGSSGSGSTSD